MLPFFRKIRQRLLRDSRFSRYLLYAIGEIVLVVVGILIALQINNWNEGKKERVKEHIYLLEFKKDLTACRKDLDRSEARTDGMISKIDTLLNLAIRARLPEDFHQLRRLYGEAYGWTTLQSHEGTINEILNGGNLSLMQNPILRSSMASWHADLYDLRQFEAVLKDYSYSYFEIVTEFPNYVDVNFSQSIDFASLKEMNSNVELRNWLSAIKHHNGILNGLYKEKMVVFDSLIDIVESELEKF